LLSYILEKEGKECPESSLREKSAVFIFLLNSMKQSIGYSQSIVAGHLLEFERAHDGQKNRQVEKEAEQPNEPPAFCSSHSRADAELKCALDDLLKRFTPDILEKASSTSTEHACEHYYAASLWTASGLLQDTSAEKIATWLQLNKEDSVFVQGTYAALKHLQEPWLRGDAGANGEWETQVFEMLQFEALGPFVFGILLSHIRDTTEAEPSSALEKFTLLSETIQKWDTDTDDKRLERQFLLKELCIGRRDAQLPTWSGAVTKYGDFDPDFCISPAANSQSKAQINDGVATDSDCNELVRFLKGKGLGAIAARFSDVMGMQWVRHFEKLQAEDLDDPDLSFLKRWQKQALIVLVQGITARSASLRDSGLDDSILTGVDTASEGGL
jgi:hypothetical protein